MSGESAISHQRVKALIEQVRQQQELVRRLRSECDQAEQTLYQLQLETTQATEDWIASEVDLDRS